MTTPQKPHRTALVFSGGGLRFGYYFGVYQAFCEIKGVPDVILASCGGALAVGILELAPDPKDAYALLCSRACYEMHMRFYGVRPKHRHEHILPAIKRWFAMHHHNRRPSRSHRPLYQADIDELTQGALYAIAGEPDKAFWQSQALMNELGKLTKSSAKSPAQNTTNYPPIKSLIILSRLVAHPHQQGYQWQELLRPSPAFGTLPDSLTSLSSALHPYNPERIHQDIMPMPMPLDVAVRASINDMYYLTPIKWHSDTLFGGVLDLTPLEIADRLADEIFIDDKPMYDRYLAQPAILSAFGFVANDRLTAVKNQYRQAHWLPLADSRQHTTPILSKEYRYTEGYIKEIRPSFESFVDIVHAQWQYGYDRTKQYLQKMMEQSHE